MSFSERIQYASFVDNQQVIESRWSKQWGDRMNELVFIGQDMHKPLIVAELESCLLTESEIRDFEVKLRFADPFPREL
jgi:hypothetical protein